MVLSDLLGRLDPIAVHGAVDIAIDRVTRDSRQAGVGAIFVAIAGGRVDGHDYLAGLPAGCVAVVERQVAAPVGVTVVQVARTSAALAQIAAAIFGDPARSLPVVGVTGTNGKTTVTTLCAQALESLGQVAGRVGTLGARWGSIARPSPLTTPEAPELQGLLHAMRQAGARAAFVEVSSAALPRGRADAIPFHTAIFTNLSRDHLDLHGTMEAYARAKALLFSPERLRAAGGPPRALLCADDPGWRSMQPPADRWLYGHDPSADLRIERLVLGPTGQVVQVRTPAGSVEIESRLVGDHNAQNLVAALGALLTLGEPLDRAAAGLSSAPPVRGRLEQVAAPRGGRLVFVDYAHTPDALAAVLRTLRGIAPRRLHVVFGCGGGRDAGKRPQMGQVASRLADRVVVTSDNPRHEDPRQIVAEILSGVDAEVTVEIDRAAAIRTALAGAVAGDIVLIAGKGHEQTQEIEGSFLPFDDVRVAAAVLEDP